MELQHKKKVALVTQSLGKYSETFIKAQIEHIPADIVLHSGTVPTSDQTGRPLLNKYKLKLNEILLALFKLEVFPLGDAVGKYLVKNKVEIVLVQYGVAGAKMLPICKKFKIPMIVHFHGYDASKRIVIENNKEAYKKMFHFSKAIIVVSKAMRSTILNLGCPEDKLHHITCGFDSVFIKNQPDYRSNTFFAVGRFTDKKAPYLSILAFMELLKEFPEARLRMAGSGELLNACKNIVKSYGIEDKVLFLGVISPIAVKNEMNKALAFIQHSIIADDGDSEGTPVSVIEAQAAALPVISTYHAGIPDVVMHEITGLLVQECDIVGMKNAMKKLLLNKALAKKFGEAGRKKVSGDLTMEKYIEKLNNLIHQ